MALSGKPIAGIVIAAVYVPFFFVSLGVYVARARKSLGIRSRFPFFAAVSALWGAVLFLSICAQQIVGESSFPGFILLWSSHLIPPLNALPYMIRAWLLFCKYETQRSWAVSQVSPPGRLAARLGPIIKRKPWLQGNKFLAAVWGSIIALHVISTALFNAFRGCYSRIPPAIPCYFFDEVALWIPMLVFYLAFVVFSLVQIAEVREAFSIRLELATCFVSWGLVAGTYFIIRLLHALPDINSKFPVSWIMALWPLSTFVISITIPAAAFRPSVSCGRRGGHGSATEMLPSPQSSPSTASSQAVGTSFDDVLRSDPERQAFKLFLVERFSSENILLWEDVESRRSISDPTELVENGKQIVTKFVSEESPMQLNLDGGLHRRLSALTDDELRSPGVFDELQKFVVKQMVLEHWEDYSSKRKHDGTSP